jgi:hypothetical protein
MLELPPEPIPQAVRPDFLMGHGSLIDQCVEKLSVGSHPQTWSLADGRGTIIVKEAEDKEPLIAGTAYRAPPSYHMLIEADRSFSLSVDPPARATVDTGSNAATTQGTQQGSGNSVGLTYQFEY